MFKDKEYILNKLVEYLNDELKSEYFRYKVIDLHGNKADLIVKKDSDIFKENIENEEYINFNIEELVDSRIFDNKDKVIITDINTTDEVIDLEYLKSSLSYTFLSYSENLKFMLSNFVKYVIEKNI